MSDMLKDRVAVITGAGGGIGSAEAKMMAARGAKVVVNDTGAAGRNENPRDAADKVVEEIRQAGGEAVASYESVAEPEGAEKIIRTAIDTFGKIDILVNNAGLFRIGPVEKITPEDWDIVLKTHLYGTFYCTYFAVPFMKEQGYGRIINTSSHVGLGQAERTTYSAVKEGITGFSRSLAREVGSFGMTCNVIRPIAELVSTRNSIPEMAVNRPEDVAALVVFLASEAADHINACIFEVWHGHVGIFADPPVVEKAIVKDGEWTPEELMKTLPVTLTAGKEREKYPLSLPLWLERIMPPPRPRD